MLSKLSITNYAIIEHLELEFKEGFTVITGETGAGKSILLGALSLIIGQRADTSVLNDKIRKCIVEGVFELAPEDYHGFFTKNELDFDAQTILRREINANGKSRSFINDTPVTLSLIKELAYRLVDIHSQHQTLEIKDSIFQINVIDAFAGNIILRSEYKKLYNLYRADVEKLNQLKELSATNSTDIDYVTFQISEIEELGLKPNEKEEIEQDLNMINNSEEIKRVLEYADKALISSDQSLTEKLKEVNNQLAKISDCSKDYEDLNNRLNAITIELDDIANELASHNDSFSFDPQQLNYLNDRISKIYSLEQKHRLQSTQEILELLDRLKSQLNDVSSYEDQIIEQTKVVEQREKELRLKANKLSNGRKKCKEQIENNVKVSLAGLGMPDAEFYIQFQEQNEFNENGLDGVEFQFSANKGFELQSINKVASGGELSRLMLTFKSILAKTKKLPTIIFDEIDTGVSGDIADKMADIMSNISKESQIISITHLPQVAAKGNSHFKIYKTNKSNRTLTMVDKLEHEDRVEELAKMLSGKNLTNEARENAKVLLNQ